jgi:hypothetical protein
MQLQLRNIDNKDFFSFFNCDSSLLTARFEFSIIRADNGSR